ncbi:MAG: hypothetical protein MUF82_02545, partial [Bacteroidetes bacterium]|nr:hypothetical protein [Bacteroidota bacterium]
MHQRFMQEGAPSTGGMVLVALPNCLAMDVIRCRAQFPGFVVLTADDHLADVGSLAVLDLGFTEKWAAHR